MRRIHALLIAAGLTATPMTAAAAPSTTTPAHRNERSEWTTNKPRLGVMVMSLTPELRTHFGAAESRGVLVARVVPATPAAAAGISVGDVIVEVNGRAIAAATDVIAALAGTARGKPLPVELVRNGEALAIDVTLTDDTAPRALAPSWFRELMSPFEELLRPAVPSQTALEPGGHGDLARDDSSD